MSSRKAHLRAAAAGLTVAAVVGGGAALLGPGCTAETTDLCAPEMWAPRKPPAELCGEPDAGSDAGDGDAAADAPPPPPSCAGRCMLLAPQGWDAPSFVWFGPEPEAPPCPDVALRLGYQGHADLHAPNTCGGCTCEPPTGSCSLPATLTAAAATCAGIDPTTPLTPFDPPAGWEGGCTTNDAVSSGKLCNGVDCVKSVTIAPLTMSETGCTPVQLPAPKKPPPTWSTFVRTCMWEPSSAGRCDENSLACVPPVPTGFRVCVFQKGDNDCSDPELAPYHEKHVFYKKLHDTRSCSPCACSSPVGGACTSEISIYGDDKCASTISGANYVISVDSTASACIDTIGGAALGSKSATPPVYVPGACKPSGGEPEGSAEPSNPATLCCAPSP